MKPLSEESFQTKSSSFPRRRESSPIIKLGSHLRGNDGLFGAPFKKYLSVLFAILFALASTQACAYDQRSRNSHAVPASVNVAELPPEARTTLRLIKQGGPFPYPRDGVVFGNHEHRLPDLPRGCTSDTLLTKSAACGRRCEAGAPAPKGSAPPCRTRYHEYTVKTPGARNRGARRIVCGAPVECYYSGDHYRTFRRIQE